MDKKDRLKCGCDRSKYDFATLRKEGCSCNNEPPTACEKCGEANVLVMVSWLKESSNQTAQAVIEEFTAEAWKCSFMEYGDDRVLVSHGDLVSIGNQIKQKYLAEQEKE